MAKFSIREGGGGFQVEFDNKVIVSVQFSSFNYCEHYGGHSATSSTSYTSNYKDLQPLVSKNAEVAVFYKDTDKWLTKPCFIQCGLGNPHDDVVGNTTPDEVAKIMGWASKLTSPEILQFITTKEYHLQEDDGEID